MTHATGRGDSGEKEQRFAQQRRFVEVARCGHKRPEHIAVPVAESHHLVTLEVLVAAVTQVVAAFLRGSGRAITVNDCQLEEPVLMQTLYRRCEDRFKAAIVLPAAHYAPHARVMDFVLATLIVSDGQALPLAAHVQHLQHVAEHPAHTQRRLRSSPVRAQVRQDNFLEPDMAQIHWNCLPPLIFRHPVYSKIWTVTDTTTRGIHAMAVLLPDKFALLKKSATSCRKGQMRVEKALSRQPPSSSTLW